MNRYYQVSGDMSAEKSRDAYPYMSLCDECVNDFEVIFEGESTSDACEACGCSGVQGLTAMTVMALALSLSAQIVQGLKMIALLVMVGNTTRNAKSAAALEN